MSETKTIETLVEALELALTFKRDGCNNPSCLVCEDNKKENDILRAAIAVGKAAL